MSVLRIKQANCKNCYKCVRVCPVKAIKIKDGQAAVDEGRCIACGQCLRACPQQAKEVLSDRQAVGNLLQGASPVMVSLAPSLVAAWPNARPGQLVAALLKLGFAGVSQTATGAALVSHGYQQLLDGPPIAGPLLTTACPAFVNLVEGYFPELTRHLAPLPSPLMLHARLLKASYPGVRLVFVGPCLAKKAEAARLEYAGLVDGVLLYSEVQQWLAEQGIRPAELLDADWLPIDRSVAALYPDNGGLLHYLQPKARFTSAVSGLPELQELLRGLTEDCGTAALIECNACSGGCLNGPDMPTEQTLLQRQQRLQQYHRSVPAVAPSQPSPWLAQQPYSTDYRPRPAVNQMFTEQQVTEVLRRIGKYSSEQELNCGACGYGSCREKAVAVLSGMAEPEMCMPFMRSRAESLANLVMESTPNGLVVVDQNLIIQEFNPAAERLFLRQSQVVKGQPLASILPDDSFRQARDHGLSVIAKKVAYPELGISTIQTIVSLAGESNSLLGVITDVTELEKQALELAVVKAETVQKAQEVIDKQMRVAQEIAGLLGEVTADSKMTLLHLIKLVHGEGERQ